MFFISAIVYFLSRILCSNLCASALSCPMLDLLAFVLSGIFSIITEESCGSVFYFRAYCLGIVVLLSYQRTVFMSLVAGAVKVLRLWKEPTTKTYCKAYGTIKKKRMLVRATPWTNSAARAVN